MNQVDILLVKDGEKELGIEIRTPTAIAFVDFRQSEHTGIRVGTFPGDHQKEPAVVVS